MNHQKIFNFKIKSNLSNDDFFVSKSNSLAHKVLLNTIKPEKYLYLKGPNKSGKTHLSQLWKHANKATLFDYNDYNKIINQNNNILIDNLNLNLNFNEEKLFHLINHCYNCDLKILITSNISLDEYNFFIADLLSRLKSFFFVEIFNPDDELINNLLIKLLHDRQINIYDKNIFSFITKRINRTYSDIYKFIEKIDNLSLAKKKEITIPLIKELL